MDQSLWILLGGIVLGCLLGYFFARLALQNDIKSIRNQAIKQSRSVILGDVNEKIAPILPGFPYDYKDMVFIGKGIDYIIFDGLANGYLKSVIFLEIKSGSSGLNKNEKSIQNCIGNGKIRYEVFRIRNE